MGSIGDFDLGQVDLDPDEPGLILPDDLVLPPGSSDSPVEHVIDQGVHDVDGGVSHQVLETVGDGEGVFADLAPEDEVILELFPMEVL